MNSRAPRRPVGKPKRQRPGMTWRGPLPELPKVVRRADLPPPVDIEAIKREAYAARELMKGLSDDAAFLPEP